MKISAHNLYINANPDFYDLEKLLPDLRQATEFPNMLNIEQLMYLGYSNLTLFMSTLQHQRELLETEIQKLQHEIDDFDLLSPSCVQVMAQESGCTWTSSNPQSFEQIATLSSRNLARACKTPHTCQFGHYIAELCKPRHSLCPTDSSTACGKTCQTCLIKKPFSGSPCIFAENTEELIDVYIGNLIGLENRYTDFIKQLSIYIDRINHAKQDIAFSRPRFLRWRPQIYVNPGDQAFHFRIKESSDGKIQIIRRRVICKDILKGKNFGPHPEATYIDIQSNTKFTCNHTNRLLTFHDYELLHKDPDFARIWLKNYTWPAYNERDIKIRTALQRAFAELLLS